MCAELLPERVRLDEWGYPILDGSPLPPELVAHARRAADACPTLALLLERELSTRVAFLLELIEHTHTNLPRR